MTPSLVVSSTVKTSIVETGVAETGFLTSLIVKESWVPAGTGILKAFFTVRVLVERSKVQVKEVVIGDEDFGRHCTLEGF